MRRRRLAQMVLPAAGLVTLVGTCAAVVTDDASAPAIASVSGTTGTDLITAARQGAPSVSRSAERPPLPNAAEAEQKVTGTLYVVDDDLEVHADAAKDSPVLATVHVGDKVDVTGKTDGDWTQIIHKELPRWVASSGVAKKKPANAGTKAGPKQKGLSGAACASGSGVESGLQPDTILVHRAVCAAFPSISRYGGRGGGGEHATGRAIDIMTSGNLGTQIAAFAIKHRRELGVSRVIWRQRIWTVQRASEGWRPMSNRGSPTANHMDHVHVTTYGSRGTG